MLAVATAAPLASLQPAAPPLTALDRSHIQQLVARFGYAMDAGAAGGQALAALFLRDGVLVTPEGTTVGHSDLALVSGRNGGAFRSTLSTNVVLEGSGSRATGKVYVVEIRHERNAGPGALSMGGYFQDEYVRTLEGWRFARREFFPSRLDSIRADAPRVPR